MRPTRRRQILLAAPVFGAPAVAGAMLLASNFGDADLTTSDRVAICVSLVLAIVGLLVELPAFAASPGSATGDRGILSGFITAVVVLVPLADRLWWRVVIVPPTMRAPIAGIGVALLTAGLLIRLWARRTLGPWFSHAVAVSAGQRLVTSGPYRYVRHPAYLGTGLITVGFSGAVGSLLGVALAVLAAPAGAQRIRREEALLVGQFGQAYAVYRERVPALFPLGNAARRKETA